MTKKIKELQKNHKLFWDTVIKETKKGTKYAKLWQVKQKIFSNLFPNEKNECILNSRCFGCYNNSGRKSCEKICLFDVSNDDGFFCLNSNYLIAINLYEEWAKGSEAYYTKLLTTMKKIRDWPLNKRFKCEKK